MPSEMKRLRQLKDDAGDDGLDPPPPTTVLYAP